MGEGDGLNDSNTSDAKATFLDLYLSISNDIVSTKIDNKPDNFEFEIVNFPCLECDVLPLLILGSLYFSTHPIW